MNDKDKQLYYEENRQALIDLNKNISEFKKILTEKIDITVKQPDNIIVKGEVEVSNPQETVEISNLSELSTALELLNTNITKAIKDNVPEVTREVSITNTHDIYPKTIKINNLSDLSKYFTQLSTDIAKNRPIIEIEKQEVIFPTQANKPISVRLSDGKSFYNAIATAFSGGAASSFVSLAGNNTQVQLTASGAVPVDIQDATVTINGDVTVSSEVEVKNDSGNPVPVSGTVTATPTGTQNVDVTANTIGLATGTKQDTGNTSLGNIDTKTPALGQALAAASTPVVLTAAQVTTLTPPAAITGFATAANQLPDGHNVTVDNASIAVTGTFFQATQPVSGTVTETNSAAILADTANIDTATAAINAKMVSGTDIGDVTINNASGANAVNIQDGGNTITVDGTVAATQSGTWTEANSAAIKTAVETIDNAISGSEMQVDVVGALPSGTNAIGKLAANSGVDIGDVDVTSSVTSSLDHGSNRDIDTTAEQITSTSFACKFGVTVKADITNTGIIYVGNSDVTAGTTAATDGFPLSAGETLTLEVNNPNLLYAIASANNQIIYWTAV